MRYVAYLKIVWLHNLSIFLVRYLTKIADQIVVLISDAHAEGIIWDEASGGNSSKAKGGSDRLFTFQVAKTREQQENVTVKPGFIVSCPRPRSVHEFTNASL